MKKYNLDSTDLSQFDSLTESEKLAWLNPEPQSYHSFHVERMGVSTYRWRNSIEGKFYIGGVEDLVEMLLEMRLRKLNPIYKEAMQQTQVLKILSQTEIDDLFSDL